MTMTITEDTAIALLSEAVAIKGEEYVYDYRDPNTVEPVSVYDGAVQVAPIYCVYTTHEGEPSCLVGLAMHLAGAELPDYDNHLNVASIGFDQTRSFFYGQGFVLTDGAARVLGRVQSNQDSGQSWGDAVVSTVSELRATLTSPSYALDW